jgi:hypothetical protein
MTITRQASRDISKPIDKGGNNDNEFPVYSCDRARVKVYFEEEKTKQKSRHWCSVLYEPSAG